MNKPDKRITLLFAVSFLMALGLFQPVMSSTLITGDDIQFTPLYRGNDDIYLFSGKNISMDGFIDGDFTAFNYGAIINGEITGNGNFCTRKLDHNGKINRSLHVCAETVNLNGIISRSAITFCSEFVLSSNGLVERDLKVFAGRADIGGTVKGDTKVYTEKATIYGVIEGNLHIEAHSISIIPPAVIKGNLTFSCHEEPIIDTAGGVVIAGIVERVIEEESEDGSAAYRSIVVTISELFAAFLFGLLILIPFRRYVNEAVLLLSNRFVVSLATGFVTVLVFMFAIAVAFISLITFLIGYALVSGDAPAAGALVLILSTIILPISSFTAVSGGILFYLGKIILAFLIGYIIVLQFKKDVGLLSKTALILGLALLAIVFEIPYLGMMLYILGSLTGAGAIVLAVRKISFEASRSESKDRPPENFA